jgi:DNA modification methylase
MSKQNIIYKYSNPPEVYRLASKYLGKKAKIFLSTKKNKKYMVRTPEGKIVHFGQMGYEDFTKHKNKTRRKNYLTRSRKIKGNWKSDKYSPNNLSIHLLW